MGLERAAGPQMQQSFAEFIKDIATKAKLNIEERGPEMIVVPWDFGEGRLQQTYVRSLGTTGGGHMIVGFFSPALKMPAGQNLSQQTANDLLRKNSQLPHGGWSIVRVENEDYLGVMETAIAQTMQPEEFYAASLVVAKIADDMEKTLGVDLF